jgi:hypothetical protein
MALYSPIGSIPVLVTLKQRWLCDASLHAPRRTAGAARVVKPALKNTGSPSTRDVPCIIAADMLPWSGLLQTELQRIGNAALVK